MTRASLDSARGGGVKIPPFLPKELHAIREADFCDMAGRLKMLPVTVPRLSSEPIETCAFVPASMETGSERADGKGDDAADPVEPALDAGAAAARLERLLQQEGEEWAGGAASEVARRFEGLLGDDSAPSAPPVLLLHGFDSSCLEWRRVAPLLEQDGLEVPPAPRSQEKSSEKRRSEGRLRSRGHAAARARATWRAAR